MRKIHWTDEAIDQALKIREYLASTSPAYAVMVINRIFERTDQLLQFPESGPLYKKAGLPQVRELLVRPYKLIYEVTDKQIRILAVFHQRQNP